MCGCCIALAATAHNNQHATAQYDVQQSALGHGCFCCLCRRLLKHFLCADIYESRQIAACDALPQPATSSGCLQRDAHVHASACAAVLLCRITPVQRLVTDVVLRPGILQLHITIICKYLPARCPYTFAILQDIEMQHQQQNEICFGLQSRSAHVPTLALSSAQHLSAADSELNV
jgi:hypothetical protein